MTRADYRDIAFEDLAAHELELRIANKQLVALVATLDADVCVYRALTHAAFDALRDATCTARRLAADRDRLRDENRWLREEHLLRAAADDVRV